MNFAYSIGQFVAFLKDFPLTFNNNILKCPNFYMITCLKIPYSCLLQAQHNFLLDFVYTLKNIY